MRKHLPNPQLPAIDQFVAQLRPTLAELITPSGEPVVKSVRRVHEIGGDKIFPIIQTDMTHSSELEPATYAAAAKLVTETLAQFPAASAYVMTLNPGHAIDAGLRALHKKSIKPHVGL